MSVLFQISCLAFGILLGLSLNLLSTFPLLFGCKTSIIGAGTNSGYSIDSLSPDGMMQRTDLKCDDSGHVNFRELRHTFAPAVGWT